MWVQGLCAGHAGLISALTARSRRRSPPASAAKTTIRDATIQQTFFKATTQKLDLSSTRIESIPQQAVVCFLRAIDSGKAHPGHVRAAEPGGQQCRDPARSLRRRGQPRAGRLRHVCQKPRVAQHGAIDEGYSTRVPGRCSAGWAQQQTG